MKTKIRQTSFSPHGNILGLIDAAQLQRRSTDAVMIPANVLTTHFGILRLCAATVGAESLCCAESLCRNTCISYFRHLELRWEANFFTAFHLQYVS